MEENKKEEEENKNNENDKEYRRRRKNVKKIKLENGVWYNLINKSKYCYPRRIDLIEGESFTLPIYSDYNEINLNDNYFILYYYINSESEPCKLLDIKTRNL